MVMLLSRLDFCVYFFAKDLFMNPYQDNGALECVNICSILSPFTNTNDPAHLFEVTKLSGIKRCTEFLFISSHIMVKVIPKETNMPKTKMDKL